LIRNNWAGKIDGALTTMSYLGKEDLDVPTI
jgi:hypothetical protein